MIDIRPEIPADYDEIRRLVRKSFETAEHTNGDEYNLVGRLRNSRAYIPRTFACCRTKRKTCRTYHVYSNTRRGIQRN